jgi:hypothetical protein
VHVFKQLGFLFSRYWEHRKKRFPISLSLCILSTWQVFRDRPKGMASLEACLQTVRLLFPSYWKHWNHLKKMISFLSWSSKCQGYHLLAGSGFHCRECQRHDYIGNNGTVNGEDGLVLSMYPRIFPDLVVLNEFIQISVSLMLRAADSWVRLSLCLSVWFYLLSKLSVDMQMDIAGIMRNLKEWCLHIWTPKSRGTQQIYCQDCHHISMFSWKLHSFCSLQRLACL